jgi:hypothetical protein
MAPPKKVTAQVKLQIEAGKATPAPPVGPALGQAQVNIMEFCKQFNARTQNNEMAGLPARRTRTRWARLPRSRYARSQLPRCQTSTPLPSMQPSRASREQLARWASKSSRKQSASRIHASQRPSYREGLSVCRAVSREPIQAQLTSAEAEH